MWAVASGRRRGARAQSGYALLVLLLLAVLGGTGLFLGASDPGAAQRAREEAESVGRLQAADDALVAYAVFGGENNVPAALPCPDYHDPGSPETGNASPLVCINGSEDVYWQRFPWSTVRATNDLAGVWYAIDARFRDEASEVEPLNPETATGSLTINDAGEYAAVLIAPDAEAEAPASVLAEENSDGDEAFVDCTNDPDCGDRARGIGSAELFALVRERVPEAVHRGLENFFSEHGHYPWAARLGDAERKCDVANSRRAGALPFAASAAGEVPECDLHLGRHPDPDPAGSDHEPTPAWVEANAWDEILPLYYAVGCNHIPDPSTCDGSEPDVLILSGEGDRAVVFGDAGPPIESAAKEEMQDREASPNDVLEYLDSPENVNADGEFNDPENNQGENDRMYAVPAP